jgi:hypothetical protein
MHVQMIYTLEKEVKNNRASTSGEELNSPYMK